MLTTGYERSKENTFSLDIDLHISSSRHLHVSSSRLCPPLPNISICVIIHTCTLRVLDSYSIGVNTGYVCTSVSRKKILFTFQKMT